MSSESGDGEVFGGIIDGVGAPAALARGTFPPGNATFDAGPLGKLQIVGSEIILGAPMIFRKDNIDAFNF